jgi:hypothetical protein
VISDEHEYNLIFQEAFKYMMDYKRVGKLEADMKRVLQQLDDVSFNRTQANGSYMSHKKGVLFFKGSFSLKNWTYRPPFRHNASPFKGTCLLIRLKEVPAALYGPHLRC